MRRKSIYGTRPQGFAFFEEGFHFITHFEGRFFTTVKTLFARPGKLSEDYCGGIRKSYFKPLSLFLLLVVVYLLFPVFEGLNMRLYYHTHHSIYGNFATQKARDVMLHTGLTDARLTTAFHAKSERVSKFLPSVILPFTALLFWAMTFKKRKYFFDQLVFATEVNSVYLIWSFMILPLLLALTEWAFPSFYRPLFSNRRWPCRSRHLSGDGGLRGPCRQTLLPRQTLARHFARHPLLPDSLHRDSSGLQIPFICHRNQPNSLT